MEEHELIDKRGHYVFKVSPVAVYRHYFPFRFEAPVCSGHSKSGEWGSELSDNEAYLRGCRMRRAMVEKLECNMYGKDCYILTLTYAREYLGSHNYQPAVSDIGNFFKTFQRLYPSDLFRYVWVGEVGTRGTKRIHFHCVLIDPPLLPVSGKDRLTRLWKSPDTGIVHRPRYKEGPFKQVFKDLWGKGFVDIRPVGKEREDVLRSAHYFGKYFTKENGLMKWNVRLTGSSVNMEKYEVYSDMKCSPGVFAEVCEIVKKGFGLLKLVALSFQKKYEGDPDGMVAFQRDVWLLTDKFHGLPPPRYSI